MCGVIPRKHTAFGAKKDETSWKLGIVSFYYSTTFVHTNLTSSYRIMFVYKHILLLQSRSPIWRQICTHTIIHTHIHTVADIIMSTKQWSALCMMNNHLVTSKCDHNNNNNVSKWRKRMSLDILLVCSVKILLVPCINAHTLHVIDVARLILSFC